MRKIVLVVFLVLSASLAFSQNPGFNGYCTQGAKSANVSGIPSTNKLLGIVPGCTVTVYLTGTQTVATTTPQSPFTADVITGQWFFTAAAGQGYDVSMSGGTPPNIYTAPSSITNLISGGGGGSVNSVTFTPPLYNSSTSTNPNGVCPTANSTVSGCLSASDWTNFNSKQNATLTVAVPTFDPPTGTIEFANFPLTLSDTTPGATIYYCTDGGTNSCNPTTLYSGPITITSAIYYVRAYASAANAFSSGIASWNGAVLSELAQPYFSPGAGIYTTAQTVTITSGGTSSLTGGGAFYTTDGSTPTCGSTEYTSPITISSTTTLQAIACATGYPSTSVTTAIFTINPSATPTADPVFSPVPGTYTAPVSVTITDSTPGSTIYWKVMYPNYPTIFCGDPGATVYSGAFVVPTNTFQLVSIACAAGYSSSAIVGAGINFTVPPPTFSLPTPYFGPGTSVSLTGIAGGTTYYCVTTGAACYPNLVYSTPLTFSSSETIYAYTFFGTAASNVVSWQGTLFTNSTTATNLAGGDATNAFPYQTAPSTTAFATASAMLAQLGAQPLLTNPVTGPGSGATVGHMAVMGNASGTSITDGGAVPTLANLGAVPNTTTVNGHTLASNVTISASDLTTGTLPHAQLPALLSGDIPNNAANTSGTAGSVTSSLTMNSSGAGTASGAVFNGSAPFTLSYNTIGAAPTASPTFTGTTTAPIINFGTGWNANSSVSPLAIGSLPWGGGPGNPVVIDAGMNSGTALQLENDSLNPAAGAETQTEVGGAATFGSFGTNGPDFFQNLGSNIGNSPNTIWGQGVTYVWGENGPVVIGVGGGGGFILCAFVGQ